jgi:hypothetical protein
VVVSGEAASAVFRAAVAASEAVVHRADGDGMVGWFMVSGYWFGVLG